MKPLTLSVLTLILTAPLACSHAHDETRAPATGADAQAFDKRGDVRQDVPGAEPLGAGGTTSTDTTGGDGTHSTGATGGTTQ